MDKGLIIHSVVVHDGKMLLLKRATKNDVLSDYWDIPGGTLEDGEDPIAGAIREAQEETGLALENLGLFFYTSNVDQAKNKQFVRLIFVASTNDDPQGVRLSPLEHSDFKWLSFDEVASYPVVDYLVSCVEALKTHPLLKIN